MSQMLKLKWCLFLLVILSCAKVKETTALKQSDAVSSVLRESDLSEDLRNFRDGKNLPEGVKGFLQITNKNEIDGMIDYLEKNYDSFSPDLKWAAAQIILLRVYRSIIYRGAPIFMSKDVAHTLVLTAVMKAVSAVKVFYPTEQWEAGLRYVTEPVGQNPEEQFKNANGKGDISKFQNYLLKSVKPAMSVFIQRLNALEIPQGRGVIWDNKLTYGTSSYSDDLDRFTVLGAAEKHGMISLYEYFIHNIDVFCAYNMDRLIEAFEAEGQLLGMNAILNGKPSGFPLMMRAKILKGSFPELYTIKDRDLMKDALVHLRASVKHADDAWTVIKDPNTRGNQQSYFDKDKILPWSRMNQNVIDNWKAIVAGKTPLVSMVTGEPLEVNVPAFYENPPEDYKAMMPTEWDEKTLTEDNYKNYLYGSPTGGWDLALYRRYFPSLKESKDVPASIRILSQTWGGVALSLPLTEYAM